MIELACYSREAMTLGVLWIIMVPRCSLWRNSFTVFLWFFESVWTAFSLCFLRCGLLCLKRLWKRASLILQKPCLTSLLNESEVTYTSSFAWVQWGILSGLLTKRSLRLSPLPALFIWIFVAWFHLIFPLNDQHVLDSCAQIKVFLFFFFEYHPGVINLVLLFCRSKILPCCMLHNWSLTSLKRCCIA